MGLVKFHVEDENKKSYYFTVNKEMFSELENLILFANLIGYKTKWHIIDFGDSSCTFNFFLMKPLDEDWQANRIVFRTDINKEVKENRKVSIVSPFEMKDFSFKEAIDELYKKIS